MEPCSQSHAFPRRGDSGIVVLRLDAAAGAPWCWENGSVGLVRWLCESCQAGSSAQQPQGATDLLFSSPPHENAERRRKSMNEMGAVRKLHLRIARLLGSAQHGHSRSVPFRHWLFRSSSNQDRIKYSV